MSTNYKTADRCALMFEGQNSKTYTYIGYVPDFFPNKHYGDYIMLSINADGTLQDFTCTDEDIEQSLAKTR